MVINIEARPSSANQRGSRIIKESIRAELPPINGHAYGLNKNLIQEKAKIPAKVCDSSNESEDSDETIPPPPPPAPTQILA